MNGAGPGPSVYTYVGHRIEDLRIRAGLTQDELDAKLNLRGGTVRRWESSEWTPSRYELELHAAQFETPLWDFFPHGPVVER